MELTVSAQAFRQEKDSPAGKNETGAGHDEAAPRLFFADECPGGSGSGSGDGCGGTGHEHEQNKQREIVCGKNMHSKQGEAGSRKNTAGDDKRHGQSGPPFSLSGFRKFLLRYFLREFLFQPDEDNDSVNDRCQKRNRCTGHQQQAKQNTDVRKRLFDGKPKQYD